MYACADISAALRPWKQGRRQKVFKGRSNSHKKILKPGNSKPCQKFGVGHL